MNYVVYNTHPFGVFAVSEEALTWINERSDTPKSQTYLYDNRHDPILVDCVCILGEKSWAEFSELEIFDIGESTKYRVCKHNVAGEEWVETPDNIEWITI